MYRIIWKDISEIDNLLLRRTGYLGLGLEGKCIFHGISLGGFFGFVSNYFMYYLWQKKKKLKKKMQNTTQDFKEIPVDSVETGVHFLYL